MILLQLIIQYPANTVDAFKGDQAMPSEHDMNNFSWLCNSLKHKQPYFQIIKRKRYTGLYDYAGRLFAYVDFQRADIKIGVFLSDVQRFNHRRKTVSFPQWSHRAGDALLVGIILGNHDNELVDILTSCYECAGGK